MKPISRIALILLCIASVDLGTGGMSAMAKDKTSKEEKKSAKAEKKALQEECKARGLKGSERSDCVNSELARRRALQQDAQAKATADSETEKAKK